MAGTLHHMAVNTTDFEKTVGFFQELFDMQVRRTQGEAPNRKLWFCQGIQVNEVPQTAPGGNTYDHIGIQVDNRPATLSKALALGCRPVEGKPAHWLQTPEGYLLELME